MDDIDRQILDVLRHDARMPVREIARRVGLSPAPLSRRIAKLEKSGVIRGYVTVIDEGRAGSLEAFTEVRLNGATDTAELETLLRDIPEARQFYTIAGDPDALVRFSVRDVEDLHRVVNDMRRTGRISGTKTLIVMTSWSRDGGESPRGQHQDGAGATA